MTDYEVARAGGQCSVTGRALEPGEEFFSALFESPQGFERRDYCVEAWAGPPEGSVCHFKTRLPERDAAKKTFIDNEALVTFFERLADTTDPLRLRFRFVLALMLLRKRLLKYERTIREGGEEFWELRLMKDRGSHRVLNPSLDDAQIAELTAELSVILAGQSVEGAGDEVNPDESEPVDAMRAGASAAGTTAHGGPEAAT